MRLETPYEAIVEARFPNYSTAAQADYVSWKGGYMSWKEGYMSWKGVILFRRAVVVVVRARILRMTPVETATTSMIEAVSTGGASPAAVLGH
jgi:hypothetical protein